MSISSIGGQFAPFPSLGIPGGASAGGALALSTGVASSPGDGALIANLDGASGGVSAALQDLGNALGSIINTTA